MSTSGALLGRRVVGLPGRRRQFHAAVTPDELSVVRHRLETFTAEMFAPMPRSNQRAKGVTYLRGLLLDGRRKSMQPMAERLGVDHQGLQQFVTASTWDTQAVRARLARTAVELVQPVAWVIDNTGFPENGKGSPCVARQYSGHRREGGELSDRGERSRGHRHRFLSAGVAAVRTDVMG